jgi:hypothetical protein
MKVTDATVTSPLCLPLRTLPTGQVVLRAGRLPAHAIRESLMKRFVLRLIALAAPLATAACAGYNLEVGTGADAGAPGGIHEVYEKPATSVETPAERSASGSQTAPPPSSAPATPPESDSKSKDRSGGGSK